MKSAWCLQFSEKLNGGNQALAAFFNELSKGDGSTLVLRGGLSNFFNVIAQNRKKWVVVSDPLCALILYVLRFQRVIHFVQSDDYDLFYERGGVFNLLYRRSYSALARFSNWERVFNSDYSRLKFNTRFGTSYSSDSVVPMLGLTDLFPARTQPLGGQEKIRKGNALWVGSKHAFKGGETFVRVIERTGINGTMLFGGELPQWAMRARNIEVVSNLNRDEVYKQMESASCYVYTSRFDSFGLPMFEALYTGCPVIALTNECVQLNKTSRYVRVVESEAELDKALSEGVYTHDRPAFGVDWEKERQRLLDWIYLNFRYLHNS